MIYWIGQEQHILMKYIKFVISPHFIFWNFVISTYNTVWIYISDEQPFLASEITEKKKKYSI